MPSNCLVAGHRGFKAKYTENTLNGFQKCFKTGATIIETDVWTTKDHVLVISHDANTHRIFCDADGNETHYNILETEYELLKPLRTIETGEPLLRFTDVLQWFIEYIKENNDHREQALADYKIMLDLKAANPPVILRLLMEEILSVYPNLSWWFPRIQLGVWHLRFVKYLNQDPQIAELFKDVSPYHDYTRFELLNISLNWQDSIVFLAYNEYLDTLPEDTFKYRVSAVSLIYTSTWSPAFVEYFVPAAKKQDLAFYSWTINVKAQLDYFRQLCSFAGFREYGVITDHPDEMVELCDEQVSTLKPPRISLFQRGLCALLGSFIALPLVNDGRFDAWVDPMKIHPVKLTLGKRIFDLLQRLGIF